jgi:hypothetical protein
LDPFPWWGSSPIVRRWCEAEATRSPPDDPTLISSAAKITDRDSAVSDPQEGNDVSAPVPDRPISVFKVFSATRAQDREVLGDRVAAWVGANPQLEVRDTVVSLTSDSRFHCISFVLICADRAAA